MKVVIVLNKLGVGSVLNCNLGELLGHREHFGCNMRIFYLYLEGTPRSFNILMWMMMTEFQILVESERDLVGTIGVTIISINIKG